MHKVGDYVSFKYDVEQSGPIEKITNGHYGKVYHVRAFHGEYINDHQGGNIIQLQERDLWVE